MYNHITNYVDDGGPPPFLKDELTEFLKFLDE